MKEMVGHMVHMEKKAYTHSTLDRLLDRAFTMFEGYAEEAMIDTFEGNCDLVSLLVAISDRAPNIQEKLWKKIVKNSWRSPNKEMGRKSIEVLSHHSTGHPTHPPL